MSKTRILRLTDVGRSKVTVDIEVSARAPPDDVALAISEKASRYLLSSNVRAVWNEETKEGSILAGFHIVGRVREVT